MVKSIKKGVALSIAFMLGVTAAFSLPMTSSRSSAMTESLWQPDSTHSCYTYTLALGEEFVFNGRYDSTAQSFITKLDNGKYAFYRKGAFIQSFTAEDGSYISRQYVGKAEAAVNLNMTVTVGETKTVTGISDSDRKNALNNSKAWKFTKNSSCYEINQTDTGIIQVNGTDIRVIDVEVTPKKAGTYNIVITAASGTTYNLKLIAVAPQVKVSTVTVGEEFDYQGSKPLSDAAKEYITVLPNGKYIFYKAGSFTDNGITFTGVEKKKARTVTLNVGDTKEVPLDAGDACSAANNLAGFSWRVTSEENEGYKYSLSYTTNSSGIRVPSFLLTGKAAGTYSIVLTAANGVEYDISLTVTDYNIERKTVDVKVGDPFAFDGTYDEQAKQFIVKLSDGKYIFYKAGSFQQKIDNVYTTYKGTDGAAKERVMTITYPEETVLSLDTSDSYALANEVRDWYVISSSDTDVIPTSGAVIFTRDETDKSHIIAKVKPYAEGTSTVKIQAANGKFYIVTINVKKNDEIGTAIKSYTESVTVGNPFAAHDTPFEANYSTELGKRPTFEDLINKDVDGTSLIRLGTKDEKSYYLFLKAGEYSYSLTATDGTVVTLTYKVEPSTKEKSEEIVIGQESKLASIESYDKAVFAGNSNTWVLNSTSSSRIVTPSQVRFAQYTNTVDDGTGAYTFTGGKEWGIYVRPSALGDTVLSFTAPSGVKYRINLKVVEKSSVAEDTRDEEPDVTESANITLGATQTFTIQGATFVSSTYKTDPNGAASHYEISGGEIKITPTELGVSTTYIKDTNDTLYCYTVTALGNTRTYTINKNLYKSATVTISNALFREHSLMYDKELVSATANSSTVKIMPVKIGTSTVSILADNGITYRFEVTGTAVTTKNKKATLSGFGLDDVIHVYLPAGAGAASFSKANIATVEKNNTLSTDAYEVYDIKAVSAGDVEITFQTALGRLRIFLNTVARYDNKNEYELNAWGISQY